MPLAGWREQTASAVAEANRLRAERVPLVEARAAIVHLYQTGASLPMIAAELELDISYVRTLLRGARLQRALRVERRWLGVPADRLSRAAGFRREMCYSAEQGKSGPDRLNVLVKTLIEMRETQLEIAAAVLADRGASVRHVLDVDGADTLDQALDDLRKLEQVHTVVATLTPAQQRIFYLRFADGHTLREIADITGKSCQNAQQQVTVVSSVLREKCGLLTTIERRIIEGHSVKAIADELDCSPATVRRHGIDVGLLDRATGKRRWLRVAVQQVAS